MHRFTGHVLLIAFSSVIFISPVEAAKNNRNRNRDAIRQLDRKINDLKREISQLDRSIDARMKELKVEAPKKVDPVLDALKEAETAEEKAQKEMLRRRETLGSAEKDLETVKDSLSTGTTTDSSYRAAEAEVIKAESNLGLIEDKLERSLRADEDYQLAKKRVETAKIRVRIIKDRQQAGQAGPQDLVRASNELLIAESRFREWKEKRFAGNDEYAKANERLSAANKALIAAKAEAVEKMKDHPQYVAAIGNVETAREAFVEANNALREASAEKYKHTRQINSMKAEVKKFASDTDRLIGRRNVLKNEIDKYERRKRALRR